MDMPFDLEFYNHKPIGEKFDAFSTSREELIVNTNKYTYTVNEAQDLRILFTTSESSSKFYIELMDTMPRECFNDEEDNFFLPSESIRPLYMNQNSNNNESKLEYPYILPGRYMIKINTERQLYFAFLDIQSLRISESQLFIMRDEVESVVKGLSKQLYNKNLQFNMNDSNFTDSEIFFKYDTLVQYSNTFLLNINEIADNPYYEIKKKYSLESLNKNIKTDLETIKYKQIRRDITHKIKGYDYKLEYNIPINRELSFILKIILSDIKQVLIFLEEQFNKLLNEKAERKKYKRRTEEITVLINKKNLELKKLKQMRSSANGILAKDWLKDVENNSSLSNLTHLLKRPSYRMLFSLYKELRKDKEKSNNLMQNYLYYWKETPLLYEIWGFIKMLEVIYSSKYNFSSSSGWIFDDNNQAKILPFLDSDTKIHFQNNDGLRFNIYYDSSITRDPALSSLDNPLFTMYSHNKPDFRLDVYKNDLYKGSLIADFKYRAMDSIGSQNIFKRYNLSGEQGKGYDVYKQLIEYSNCETHYFRTKVKGRYPEKTVKSVWALFPIFEESSPFLVDKHDSTVQRISLSPNGPVEHVRNELENLVDYYLNQ